MKILKGYVKNPHRPEASIVERYVAEEAVEFCTEYLSRAKSVGLPKSRHVGRSPGKGTLGGRMKSVDREELLQAHLYILTNTPEVQPYLDTHRRLIKEKNPRKAERWLVNEHNKTFISWFKNEVANCPSASNTVSWLAAGPNFDIISWRGYDINGYSFYTKERDEKSTMQNSGVSVEAESMHFSSAKDKNPLCASSSYFGIIEEIWELNYVKFTVPVFKCKWVDSNNGVKVDELGFTLVDFRKVGYKNEPFIMASQAKQVFYVIDPSNENCSVVLHGKRQVSDDDKNDLTIDVSEFPSTRSRITVENEEVERDDSLFGEKRTRLVFLSTTLVNDLKFSQVIDSENNAKDTNEKFLKEREDHQKTWQDRAEKETELIRLKELHASEVSRLEKEKTDFGTLMHNRGVEAGKELGKEEFENSEEMERDIEMNTCLNL
ncbi:Unknown protein [Striga hermonthica]|uniref:DUF4216 domain-containing protein n=1 Tax=Striga hermonthica TaxID=68872 RepID=A0A9N7MU15_STRHE|nr:Unknown protein [Striga hermonthica]